MAYNLRAIALALAALRAVERYGVTRRQEQYKGWAELPLHRSRCRAPMRSRSSASTAGFPLLSRSISMTLTSRGEALHPDTGGNVHLFHLLSQAKAVIEECYGW